MKRKACLCILTVGMLAGSAMSLSFRQVAYIPNGIVWGYGYIKGIDANHDGYQDLIFSNAIPQVVYYGYRPYNRYVPEDSCGLRSMFWDVGNLDGDSLMDVVVQRSDNPTSGIRVYEPINYWTFPKQSVWAWPFEYIGNGVQEMYITDLDRDGLKEILSADAQVVYVFENRGNNQYVKVFSDTTGPWMFTPPMAFGDFDEDGRMEFVRGTLSPPPRLYVYKCTGDDQYQMVWRDTLINEPNNYDLITGPDFDGNGKLEFIVGNVDAGNPEVAKINIYESMGINQYQVIFADSVPVTARGVYCVHSDCGDVDIDGKPELVWAIDRDWMVYKYDSLAHQFQRVYSAYGDNGHNSTNIHIHDMNGNGYPEVIESGGNETHIWEVEACRLVYPNGGETLYCDTSYTIRWRNVAPFMADSFSLFFSTDSSRSYSLIAHGIPGSDSSYVWTVPDTLSDTCFIMLWAYQNATGWDFSDAPFTVRPAVGVEAFPAFASRLTPYVPCPNPFVSYAQVPGHEKESFSLYDVSGRKVGIYKGDRIGSGLSAGIYFLKPVGMNAKPLRVVKLR